jgi:peptidoglycan/xylan/chitin deacetylase (PgdA/CDA1 family)
VEPQYLKEGPVREVILTFDDGPHPVQTPKLLDTLAKFNIKAVFFVLGKKLETEQGRAIIKRAVAEGHTIGNHSYSHPDLTKLKEPQIRDELEKTQALIGECSRGLKLLRPPHGAHNQLVDRIARDLGFRLVLWSVDTMDWHPKYKPSGWVDFGLEQIEAREHSLVLAHDIHRTTVEKVEELVSRVKSLPSTSFVEFA